MRLQLKGEGQDLSPDLTALTSPLVIGHIGWENTYDVALLQGGLDAMSDGTKAVIKWKSLYGYRRMAPVNWKMSMDANDVDSKFSPEKKLDQKERDAFVYAHDVYLMVHHLLWVETGLAGSKLLYHTGNNMELKLDALESIKDRVFYTLDEIYARERRVRDTGGSYGWIGLKGNVNGTEYRPESPMTIEKARGTEQNIILYGEVTPYEMSSDRAITTWSDGCGQAIIAGLLHGFEGQMNYEPACAIRAALLSYVFDGKFEVEKLMAALTRDSWYPRLGSSINSKYLPGVQTSEESITYGVARAAISFGLAWMWFAEEYAQKGGQQNLNWGKPLGEVRFTWEGPGAADTLAARIKNYFKATILPLKDSTLEASDGPFFLPGTNVPGASFTFDFANWVGTDKGGMHIMPREYSSAIHLEWSPEAALVKRGILDRDQTTTFEHTIRPIVLEGGKSTRLEWKWAGMSSLIHRTLKIRDRVDPSRPYLPSEVVESLLLGWSPAYTPSGIIMSRSQMPSRLEGFENFEVYVGRSNMRMPAFKVPQPRSLQVQTPGQEVKSD